MQQYENEPDQVHVELPLRQLRDEPDRLVQMRRQPEDANLSSRAPPPAPGHFGPAAWHTPGHRSAGRESLKAASAIRAGSQERSGVVLTASSQATEFTMVSGGKRCSCGMSQCGMPQCVTRRSCSSARAVVRREQALELLA